MKKRRKPSKKQEKINIQIESAPSTLVKASADTQHRSFHLVINNPADSGFTQNKIAEILESFKSLVYYCMADEQGSTYHTHIYAKFKSTVRFSTMKNSFPTAHIDPAQGTAQDNRAYILKEGKWENDEKHGTTLEGTFREYGDITKIVDRQGARTDIDVMYQLINEGWSDAQILEAFPNAMLVLDKIQRARTVLLTDKMRETFRKLEVTYIFGKTATGKTRFVMESNGYSQVYKITNYQHPFDAYQSQDVMLFDEFHSQLKIQDMLNYLDGYPLELPARYSNKTACFTKVFIVSNIPLEEQYKNVQEEKPEVWQAFLRRISQVCYFNSDGKVTIYSTEEHLERLDEEKKNHLSWTDVTGNIMDAPF